jgi:hypothetical protein
MIWTSTASGLFASFPIPIPISISLCFRILIVSSRNISLSITCLPVFYISHKFTRWANCLIHIIHSFRTSLRQSFLELNFPLNVPINFPLNWIMITISYSVNIIIIIFIVAGLWLVVTVVIALIYFSLTRGPSVSFLFVSGIFTIIRYSHVISFLLVSFPLNSIVWIYRIFWCIHVT